MRVNHCALSGLNDPLNDILETPEVLRGALGDISRKSSRTDKDIFKRSPADAAGRTLIGRSLGDAACSSEEEEEEEGSADATPWPPSRLAKKVQDKQFGRSRH